MYRKGLLRQLQRLEAEAFLARQPGGADDRVYRLTPKGRLAALGGRDPEELWSRRWDGCWRLLMFDLPATPSAPRRRLRRVLKEHGLGCLQGSVWTSPDPLEPLRRQLKGDRHPASLLLFEGHSVGGEKDREIVLDGWDFDAIHVHWCSLENLVYQGKTLLKGKRVDGQALEKWIYREYCTWKKVLHLDPFLPSALLPTGYKGRRVWAKRKQLYLKLSRKIREEGISADPDDK